MNGWVGWPVEREDRLRELWRSGLTARECAIELGVSRNAVIGKVHRMGLESRANPIRPRLETAEARQRRIDRQRTYRERVSASKHRTPKPPRPPKVKAPPVEKFKPDPEDLAVGAWNALPDTTPVGLIDLTATSCRWPVSEGAPFLFCGCEVAPGSSYCPTHKHIGTGKGTTGEQNAVKAAQSAAKSERHIRQWLEAA